MLKKLSWDVKLDAILVAQEDAKSVAKVAKVGVILIVLFHAIKSVMQYVPTTAIRVVQGEIRLTENKVIA